MQFGTINKILFIGGGDVTLPLALWCKKRGIGFSMYTSPRHAEEVHGDDGKSLQQTLEDSGFDTYVHEDINNDPRLAEIVDEETLALAAGPAWIFKQPVLNLFNGRMVNFHSIPLPRFRGGAHFTWQILQRDRSGGLNIQLIERKLDAGAVIMSERYNVPGNARKPIDYFAAMNSYSMPFLKQFIGRVAANEEFTKTQIQEEFSLYMPRLNTAGQAFIDWSWPGDAIHRFIDAFDNPYPGAATFLNGEIVRLKNAELDPNDGTFHPFQSGLVVRKSNGRIFVGTSEGTLIVSSLTDQAGEDQSRRVKTGDRLHTPKDSLHAAMTFQARYDARGARA
jgi:methionyl-tRNA formyltransferase